MLLLFEEEHDRNDLYQEILIDIWRSLERFKEKSKISTWIYRISINTAITFSLKENKRKLIFKKLEPGRISSVQDASDEDSVVKENKTKLLTKIINDLPLSDRTIITLYMENLEQKEIANISGLTPGNIRVKLHRIKKLLREKLKFETKSHG